MDWPAHRQACPAIQDWVSSRGPDIIRMHLQIHRWITCGSALWEWAIFQALRRNACADYVVHVLLERLEGRRESHTRFRIRSITCVHQQSDLSPLPRVTYGPEELVQQEEDRHKFFIGDAETVKMHEDNEENVQGREDEDLERR